MSKKFIKVIDGLVTMVDRNAIYEFVRNSRYGLGWADSQDMSKSQYKSIHSQYSIEDVAHSGLGNYLNHPDVAKYLEGYTWTGTMVNLSTPSDVNFTHTHPAGQRIVLYYANLEWKSEWYGETMFFNDTDDEILLASRYTPGRIIVFDGAIPHSIRPQSSLGPQYRFTVASVFAPRPKAEE